MAGLSHIQVYSMSHQSVLILQNICLKKYKKHGAPNQVNARLRRLITQ